MSVMPSRAYRAWIAASLGSPDDIVACYRRRGAALRKQAASSGSGTAPAGSASHSSVMGEVLTPSLLEEVSEAASLNAWTKFDFELEEVLITSATKGLAALYLTKYPYAPVPDKPPETSTVEANSLKELMPWMYDGQDELKDHCSFRGIRLSSKLFAGYIAGWMVEWSDAAEAATPTPPSELPMSNEFRRAICRQLASRQLVALFGRRGLPPREGKQAPGQECMPRELRSLILAFVGDPVQAALLTRQQLRNLAEDARKAAYTEFEQQVMKAAAEGTDHLDLHSGSQSVWLETSEGKQSLCKHLRDRGFVATVHSSFVRVLWVRKRRRVS